MTTYGKGVFVHVRKNGNSTATSAILLLLLLFMLLLPWSRKGETRRAIERGEKEQEKEREENILHVLKPLLLVVRPL